MIHTVKLASKKAEEYKEAFPDGLVPVSSNRMDFDAVHQSFYYRIDNSVLTSSQSAFLLAKARKEHPDLENMRDADILASAAIKREDICCPDCGTEGSHNCQAITDSQYLQSLESDDEDEETDDEDEEDFDEDGGEEEEPELDFTGSLLEAQLTQRTADNQCRQCRGFFEELRGKPIQEKFCSENCKKEWDALVATRIQIGIHDLNTRGFD